MDLSIIIVNWNSKEYLRSCIASILAKTRGIEFEIVVIDNASFDGCDQMLRQYYPQVRFIQSNHNLGFAKANNAAFRESCGRYVLFLNPDTELVTPAVNIMFDSLQRLPNTGAVNCKLLNADKTVQTSCIQSFPTTLNQLLDSEFLRALGPKWPLWGMAPLFGAENGPEEVEALSGACLMLKRTLFEQVGLFSEDYFMYAEDIDLCCKIRQAGYKNYYVPNASIIHFGGGSTPAGSSDFSAVMIRQSVWQFLRKTRGKTYSLGYRISILFSAIGRIAFLMIFLPLYIVRWDSESWKSSLRKWRAILGWSLGLENWLKNWPRIDS
jgi:GT2 family glycosyltransferase